MFGSKTPCIIFLDEIDAIAPNRANVKGEGHHDLSKLTFTQEDMYTALARNVGRSSTGADITWLTDATAAPQPS